MNREKLYLAAGGTALVLLLAGILWGPAGENEKEKEAYLWEKSWDRIEFYRTTGDNKEGSERELMVRLLRTGGLLRHTIHVETPEGGVAGAPMVGRLAGGNAKNIFRDWAHPPLKGLYKEEAAKPEITGLDNPRDEVRLYKKADSPPVRILFGRKSGSSDVFTKILDGEGDDTVYLLPEFLRGRFMLPYHQLREKAVVILPSGGRIRTLMVRTGADREGYLTLDQIADSRGDGTKRIWTDREGETIPPNLTASLEGMIQRIAITHFRDEEGFGSLRSEELWKQGGDRLDLTVELSDGESVEIRLLMPKTAVHVNDLDYAMISTSREEGADYILANQFVALKETLKRMHDYLKHPERNSKTGETR